MKKIIISLTILSLLACKNEEKETSTANEKENAEMAVAKTVDYEQFGEKIDEDNVWSAEEMKEKFSAMKVGDTIDAKFKANVEKVCKKKGCWMTLKLDDSLTSFVRFKDYGFFVPLNAENRETIVEGKAFVSETSVEELKHYAKDAGKSEEEIAAITESEKEYAFMATGVLMEGAKEE